MGHENRDYNIEEHRKTYKGQDEKLSCEKRDSILGNEKRDSIGKDFDYVQDAINSYIEEQQQQQKWVF
jgi:hypothetical protein